MIEINVEDDIEFIFQKMEPIREDDAYNNFRVHLKACFGKINAPMKIDITTGDIITPLAIEYSFKLLFEDKSINVMAYNIETILAEKYETIIRRNIGTTRARDFYDLYSLFKGRSYEIRKDKSLEQLWINYQKDNYYAIKISFEAVTNCLIEIASYLNIDETTLYTV